MMLSILLSLVVSFGAFARGGHDIWSASIIYITVTLLVITLFWQSGFRGQPLNLPIQPMVLLMLGLLAFYVSYRRSVNPSEAILQIKDWAAAGACFVLAVNIFKNKNNHKPLIIIGNLTIMGLFVINLIDQIPKLHQFIYHRSAATLVNANIAATYFLIWTPLMFQKFQESKTFNERLFFSAGILALFLNLVFAKSVFAWVCLGIITCFQIGLEEFKNYYRQKKALFWGGMCVILIISVYAFIDKYQEYVGPSVLIQATSRWEWWSSAVLMWKAYPWFGVGPGNFPSAYLAFKVGIGQNTLFPHSFPLGLLAETGLIGFSLAALFFGVVVRLVARHWDAIQINKSYLLGAAAAFIFSWANIGFEYLTNLLVLFIFIGAGLSSIDFTQFYPRKSVSLIVLALGIFLIPSIVMPFFASQNVVYADKLVEKGDFEEALREYKEAVQLDPKSWQAHQGLARVYRKNFIDEKSKESIQLSIAHFDQAILLNRYNGYLFYERGQSKQKAKDFEGAKYDFETAILYHKSSGRFRVGLINLEMVMGKKAK